MGHAWQYARATLVLEDARAETIQKGHLESHPYFANVEHLERKKLV